MLMKACWYRAFFRFVPNAPVDAVRRKGSKSTALIVILWPVVWGSKLQNYQSDCVYGCWLFRSYSAPDSVFSHIHVDMIERL